MSDFVVGIPIGIAIGIAIGISIGIEIGKQKPWSELTEEEKKIRKSGIGAGIVILLLGVIVFLWLFFT
ncbi:MAG: hypothetical protein JSW06_05700 [Thermoplasmatales archaeon]|nr:MAG: hypothetical protein JSW06_05700 [Thermoplasmatales archaeon]